MINEVSYEYAKSLFELSNDKLETFNCLETISSVLSDEVINVLTHPLINKNDKKEIINKSFSEYFNETFLHFLFVLIDNNRIDEINNIKIIFMN
jgi:ATP synthase F1 delta subunit